eukprot:m.432455 g.432455  ORF g.432455 m.432455 type:complete len:98 (+) comp17437_c0_seq1:793-1086(+)
MIPDMFFVCAVVVNVCALVLTQGQTAVECSAESVVSCCEGPSSNHRFSFGLQWETHTGIVQCLKVKCNKSDHHDTYGCVFPNELFLVRQIVSSVTVD